MFNCVRISILERCSSVKYHLGMAGRRAEKAVEKARRKAPLGREEVVGAALGLLDEVGLDGLTTRRLAERLGVRVGALYWHVSSKQELLAAIAGRIMEELSTRPVAEGGGRSGPRRRRNGCGACSSPTATVRGCLSAPSGSVPTSLWSPNGSWIYCGRPAFLWRWLPTAGTPSPASSPALYCRSKARLSVQVASRRSQSVWPRSWTLTSSRTSPSGSLGVPTTRTGTSMPS